MKKILAIALVAVLMLSLLTACKDNGGNSGGGNNNTPSNSTPSGNGGNNSTTTPPASSTPSETPSGNNGEGENGGGEITEAVNEAVEKIQTLMKNAGYNPAGGGATTDKDVLFGASSGLMYMKSDLGMLQIYFYPSESAAATGKSTVWEQSAKDLNLVCKISENFVYIGDADFVAVLDNLLK